MTNRIAVIIVVTLALVALLGLAQQLINLRRLRRARQAALPVLALIYCAVAVTLAFRNYDRLGEILAEIGFIVQDPAIVLNAMLAVGFIIVKAALLPLVNFLWKIEKLIDYTSRGFYEYDSSYSEWFLKRKWANVRALFLSAFICVGAICAGLFSIMLIKGPESQLWLFCFPMAALVATGEIFGFLNGRTRAEFVTSVLGEDADSRRISNFYRIREIYERMFPGQILAAHTGSEFTGWNSAEDFLKKLSEGDKFDRITAGYFAFRGGEFKPDLDCVMAANKLMHGRSVVFLNPFYRDMGRYIVPAFTKALIAGKKCLVVAGRNSTFSDIVQWLRDELAGYNNVSSLWRIRELGGHPPDCDIGVVCSRHMYDMNILKANREFFTQTDFVFIVEPSLMVNIGQIGFNIIVDELHKNIAEPTFCICDRNADGLVDTMSHLLRTEITDVIAPPIPRGVYSGMAWSADGDYSRQQLFDKQTRYMGNGVELAAVAIKNQVPRTTWYSETKSPVRDVNWIAGQYHPTLCRYMNIPSQQSSLYDRIGFESNIWGAPCDGEAFMIVEDEFCNMFSTLRAYLSRGKDQAFINVLSENYLLRDYMRCNARLFLTDPGAVPSFVPDYAKTLRNTVIKLILHMTVRPVSETEVNNELYLAGCKSDDAFSSLSRLVRRFSGADDSIFTISPMANDESGLLTDFENCFRISPDEFERRLGDSLKSAFYIIEDEKSASSYIDAKLFGHVTQTILPGQFMTYDGKYYFAKIVSPSMGVVLRRASDLYDSRKYYRQIRAYTLNESDAEATDVKRIMDIGIAYLRCTFDVRTTGYLEMNDNNDLRTARVVDFRADPRVGEYSRHYRNKTVMRLDFPEADDKIRFTICMLMMEVFRSLFPSSWHYLAAVATRPEDISGMLNYVTYELVGDISNEYIYVIEDSDVDLGLLDAVDKNLIQIMEIIADFLDWHFDKMRESPMEDPEPVKVMLPQDIKRRGMFVRMADRIRRIFGGKEENVRIELPDSYRTGGDAPAPGSAPAPESAPESGSASGPGPEPAAEPAAGPGEEADGEAAPNIDGEGAGEEEAPVAPAPQGGSVGSSDYSLDSESEETEGAAEAAAPASAAESKGVGEDGDGAGPEGPAARPRAAKVYEEDLLQPGEDADTDLVHIDGTDIFDEDDDPYNNEWLEERFVEAGIVPLTKSRYQRECYLKYGFEDIDARIRAEDVRNYLRLRGFTNNMMTKSRLRSEAPKTRIDLEVTNHCDFCGMPLTGVSYERINDGRIRCCDCSSSAIETLEEARELFYKVRELVGCLFGIELKVPIGVKIVDAHVIARGWGSVFKPSTAFAPRVLGYASKRGGSYFLFMENGSPRLAFLDTMVHELTHIWQFVNWDSKEIEKLYGNGSNRDIVYEGMAMWASVQYLYQIGETAYAELQESSIETRQDVYGVGFCLYREKYPFVKDFSVIKFSPFSSMPPL